MFRTAGAADADDVRELPPAAAHVALREIGGSSFALTDELTATDVVVVVATGSTGRDYAAAIGQVCRARAIMTAGVVLGTTSPNTAARDAADGAADITAGTSADTSDPVAALRPYARVLLPTADEADLVELLTALRV